MKKALSVLILAGPSTLAAAEPLRLRLDLAGVNGRSSRVVKLDAGAPGNNIKVIHFGRSDDLGNVPLRLKPWDVRWIEIE